MSKLVSQVWRPGKRSRDGVLLLDTHVWLWMLTGALDRLANGTAQELTHAAERGDLRVCDISFWEVAQKVTSGKLSLSLPLVQWLDHAAQAPSILTVPLTREAMVSGAQLIALPGDPVDRWLVATAKLNQWALMTADSAIIKFAAAERLTQVCDVTR